MKKTYVLDTNVLLHSPKALFSFNDNYVVIPDVVLEELDNMKKGNNDLGVNARHVARLLDGLRENGKLSDGVLTESGGEIRIESADYDVDIPKSWDVNKADNRIIQICKGLSDKGEDVILITKDIFERIKADTVGIKSEDFYEDVVPNYDQQYTARKD
ncbi:PIN domain-containing protein, partial [uncultured Clostridium sp.]|uniref:PIN domain-containing protein n=1 Tax=uncultured Clostridium sp. TaxID=59620 RepID=UPI00263317E4